MMMAEAIDNVTAGERRTGGDRREPGGRRAEDRRRARAGEEHLVMAWLLGREGRKSRGAAALVSPEGEICGISEGLWIALRDPATHGAKVAPAP